MNYLTLTSDELAALEGLPYVQQVLYFRGIKPYMDRKTGITGIKRRISYQSLCEALYIEPIARILLSLQIHFGLTLSEAGNGRNLKIRPSWTKGGIRRSLEITTDAQWQWLKKIARLVRPGESLIPVDRTYKQHLSRYQAQTKTMGVVKLHGLRHAYAQRRYHELTRSLDPRGQGLLCPMAGGVRSKVLKGIEKDLDRQARMILTREWGHSRIAITKIYL